MLPNTLSMDLVHKKITRASIVSCVLHILKMDLKNVKILLNFALKRGTSQTFLKKLITSKPLKIIIFFFFKKSTLHIQAFKKQAKKVFFSYFKYLKLA
jgi:hypothetical protein